jgi:type VI secretion system VgrG family protein
MTMNMGTKTNLYFESKAKGMPADTFRVIGFKGHEEISRPFRFEIELASEKSDIDVEEILRWPAFLAIERDGGIRRIHGVLGEFEQMREGPLDLYHYRAVLVPRLWLLSMSSQNQIYQNKSVPQIIEEELKGTRNKGPAELATAGLTAGDFELRLTRKYSAREYTVQYQESDLDFISRLMEHEGIFYFFEHDEDKEKIIITDNNIHFPAMAEESTIRYRPPSGMAAVGEESVQSISCRSRRMPKKVILKDYNYRTPHVPLQGEAAVDTKGHGLISEYGNHFKKPEEGVLLARIRAEEIRCRQKVFEGEGDCSQFRPGHRYTLDEHYREDFNREYVITGVSHTGTQPIASASGTTDEGREQPSYCNEFTAIPSDVPFRPERRTPKPKLYGIMHAHVDSALLEDRAEIDQQGRYKVVMPFDLSGAGEGKASRFIRMAQPYGGKNQGMHFPLHKGTEVIWACIDGDPDRPIILGAVPNPLNPSVVTDSNYTKNVIRTASGSFLEFNDGPGLGAVVQKVTGSQLQLQQQYQKDEASNEKSAYTSSGTGVNREDAVGKTPNTAGYHLSADDQEAAGVGNLVQQRQCQDPVDHGETTTTDKWFRVRVPDYEDTKDVYLRMGDTPSAASQSDSPSLVADGKPAGWYDYTDGVHTSISGPTVDPADTSILDDPNRRRAEPPNVDAAMWTEYGIGTPPPSPYAEYEPMPGTKDAGFWRPSPGKTEIEDVINKKNRRYYPYWDEKTSKRQQYDADPSRNQWKYSYDVKKDDLVRGSHNDHVLGDRMTTIEGTWTVDAKGHLYNTAWGHVHSDYYQNHSESYYGDVLDVYGQPDADVTVTEIAYGPKYEWHFGDKVEVVHTDGGTIYEYHKANKTEYVEGYMEEDHLGGKKTTIRGSEKGPEIVEKLFVDDETTVHVDYGGWVAGDFMHTIESYHGSKEERYYGAHSSMDLGLKNDFFLGPLKIDVMAGIILANYGVFVHDLYGALHFESGMVSIQEGEVDLKKGDISVKLLSGVNVVT